MSRRVYPVLVLVGGGAVAAGCNSDHSSASGASSSAGSAGSAPRGSTSGGQRNSVAPIRGGSPASGGAIANVGASASGGALNYGGNLGSGASGTGLTISTTGLACALGATKCATACVDLTKDNSNCGQCGNMCASWAPCTNGICTSINGGAGGTASTGGSPSGGSLVSGGRSFIVTGGVPIGGSTSGGTVAGGVTGRATYTRGGTLNSAGAAGNGGTTATGGAATAGVTGGTRPTAGAAGNSSGCFDTASISAVMNSQYAHATITTTNDPNKTYVAYTNWWGGFTDQTVTLNGIGFEVTNSASSSGNNPLGFPSLYIGSYNGIVTSGSHLPIRIPSIQSAYTVLDTNATSLDTSDFNAVYDIWFTPTGDALGSSAVSPGAGGAYLMLWLYKPANRQPRGTRVSTARSVNSLSGTWDVWIEESDPPCISYVATSPLSSVAFDLRFLIKDAIGQNLGLTADHYLNLIFAGFEIWSGGSGAKINRFCANIL